MRSWPSGRYIFAGALFFLILLVVLFFRPVPGKAETPATLSIAPDATTITLGDTIMIDILAGDVSGLYGVDISVEYDPSVLQAVDTNASLSGVQLQQGSLLPPPGGTLFTLYDLSQANNTTGVARYAATLVSPTEPVNGSGVIFSILFQSIAETDNSPITITSAALATKDGESINYNLSNATIVVRSPAPAEEHYYIYMPLLVR